MKRTLLNLFIAGAALGLAAQAQTTSPGVSAGAVNPGTSATGTTHTDSAGSSPSGLERREQSPPGFQTPGQTQPSSGSDSQARFTATNQFDQNLTPTSAAANPNTNSPSDEAQSTAPGSGDRAATPSDQRLLMTIRQTVSTYTAASRARTSNGEGESTRIPVSYVVNGGIVQLVGTVSTIQEKQRIEALVQRVPGVTRVVNQLQISSTSTTGTDSPLRSGDGEKTP